MKQEEKRIGDYTYRVTQLDAIEGSRVFVRFTKTFGPALSSLNTDDFESTVGSLIAGFTSRLEEKDFEHYCRLFAKLTEVEGGDLEDGASPQLSDIFAVHFAGRYLELVRWLIFCFEVNFRGFFDGAGDLLRKATASASKSPKASTSSSGDS